MNGGPKMLNLRRAVSECANVMIRRGHQSGSNSSQLFGQLPGYESVYNLGKIYPKSSLSVIAKREIPISDDKFSGYIPMDKIKTTFCRSAGPGGQNVNKVNSKAIISFHLASADWVPEGTREKLAQVHKNNISKEGIWSIRSDKTRSQFLNIADCVDKLRCYIAEVEQPPKVPSVETLEKKRASIERAAANRLRSKRHISMIKTMKKVDL